jgi:hypothetical protein
MATIDVGLEASNRGSTAANAYTWIAVDNPANDSGVLDVFEVWLAAKASSGLKVGTFARSDTTDFTSRDYENIGSTNAGSKQTFTGKNCDVSTDDCIGIICNSSFGTIERDTSGYGGIYYKDSDIFGAGKTTCRLVAGDAISVYATGATAAAGNPYYYYLQQ